MRRLLLAAASAALLAAGASAMADIASDNPVVAKVNGQEIRKDEITAAYQTLPEQYRQMPMEMLFDPLLQRVIDAKLLSAEAEKENIADEPATKAALERARASVLRDQLLQQAIDKGTTDEALHAAYDEARKGPDFAIEEVHAKHILLADEADALAVIAELDKGANFDELAKAKSKDPSAQQNSGDLGFFKKEAMVPEFSAAAFAMEPGTYSKTPVKSQFGWHVIEVVEKRKNDPTFEEMEPQLREDIARKIVTSMLENAREGATIERFNIDGSPRPAGAEPAPAPAAN
jgi:peptidyl-prolyl cis-trans isomerase C